MDILIGFVTGLLILVVAVGTFLNMVEVRRSSLETVTKVNIYLYVTLGFIAVIEFFIKMSLLLIDKL